MAGLLKSNKTNEDEKQVLRTTTVVNWSFKLTDQVEDSSTKVHKQWTTPPLFGTMHHFKNGRYEDRILYSTLLYASW